MKIYYFCPDLVAKSAGIRLLYRHVQILVRHGFEATILHEKTGFQMPDMPPVPVAYLDAPAALEPHDVVVLPEGYPGQMAEGLQSQFRRFVIALNWDYVFDLPTRDSRWPSLGIEHILTNSSFIGDFLSWSMKLPVSVFGWGINPALYFPTQKKELEVVFILRKQKRIEALMKVLYNRDPRFITDIRWIPLEGFSESNYAEIVRRAVLFINLSDAEGLPCSLLEAMRCNTLVAGYNSVGGQRELIGEGPQQNMILVPNLDYPALAVKLEPVLLAMLAGDGNRFFPIVRNAYQTSLAFTPEAEEASVVAMWQKIAG